MHRLSRVRLPPGGVPPPLPPLPWGPSTPGPGGMPPPLPPLPGAGGHAGSAADPLTRFGAADRLVAGFLRNVSYRSLNGWLHGSRPIPENLAEWLREVAVALDKAPPLPRGWKG